MINIHKRNGEVITLPINSEKKNMKNKKCDYKTLAIMTYCSNMKPIEQQDETGVYEKYRYVYKNKIIELTDEIEQLSNSKINTIVKNMRKLSQLEGNLVNAYKNEEGKIYYTINYTDERSRKFVSIEADMLRTLINKSNSNGIKAYILIKYLCEGEEKKTGKKEKKITNGYIAEQIGLSSKSKCSLQVITDITNLLDEISFIRKRIAYFGGKRNVYYSVLTHEEWIEAEKDKDRIRRERKPKE